MNKRCGFYLILCVSFVCRILNTIYRHCSRMLQKLTRHSRLPRYDTNPNDSSGPSQIIADFTNQISAKVNNAQRPRSHVHFEDSDEG